MQLLDLASEDSLKCCFSEFLMTAIGLIEDCFNEYVLLIMILCMKGFGLFIEIESILEVLSDFADCSDDINEIYEGAPSCGSVEALLMLILILFAINRMPQVIIIPLYWALAKSFSPPHWYLNAESEDDTTENAENDNSETMKPPTDDNTQADIQTKTTGKQFMHAKWLWVTWYGRIFNCSDFIEVFIDSHPGTQDNKSKYTFFVITYGIIVFANLIFAMMVMTFEASLSSAAERKEQLFSWVQLNAFISGVFTFGDFLLLGKWSKKYGCKDTVCHKGEAACQCCNAKSCETFTVYSYLLIWVPLTVAIMYLTVASLS